MKALDSWLYFQENSYENENLGHNWFYCFYKSKESIVDSLFSTKVNRFVNIIRFGWFRLLLMMLGYLTLEVQWTIETMVDMLLLWHLAESIVVTRLRYAVVKHRIPYICWSVDVHVSLKGGIIDFL